MYSPLILIPLVIAGVVQFASTENDSNYLQDTIKDLTLNMDVNTNVMTPSPIKRAYTNQEAQIPTLQLTKAELAALYESAVMKGDTIKLDPGDGSTKKIKAVVHAIDEHSSEYQKDTVGEKDGYYYYYYPLKSFMDEMSSSSFQHERIKVEDYPQKPHEEEVKPYVHSHHHQHNVHIEPMKNMVDTDKKKGLEPLFMAISGFIGMTIMFILSILILPKIDKLKPKGFKNDNSEVTSITRVVLQAIEGRDCAERLACEAGKTAKAFNLHDNRFVKLLRRIAPNSVVKQIDKMGKYTDKKFKCAAIQCKRRGQPAAKLKRKPKLL